MFQCCIIGSGRSSDRSFGCMCGNDNVNTHKDTVHMSLQEIMSLCDDLDNEEVRKIFSDARTLLHGNRDAVRLLCGDWGVDHRHAGERNNRRLPELKAELHAKLAKRVRELQEKETCNSASEQRPTTSVPSFCFTVTSTSTLQELQQLPNRNTLLARVIDHACYSEDSISRAVADMLQQAEIKVLANLARDQPIDAWFCVLQIIRAPLASLAPPQLAFYC